MRELLYLSDSKIQQFVPSLRTLWNRPDIAVTSPFGGIAFNGAPDARRTKFHHLARVVKRIERSARWFTEPVQPGAWVAFEAPMNYFTLGAPFGGILLFSDIPRATEYYPSGGRVRLILHGSSRHLLISRPAVEVNPPGEQQIDAVFGGSSGDDFEILVSNLDLLQEALHSRGVDPPAERIEFRRTHALRQAALQLVTALDAASHQETAAMMVGYARVTAYLDSMRMAWMSSPKPTPEQEELSHAACVVATPLYVEYGSTEMP
ncbi:SAVMC3_10250 family protein [Streptomyces sp. NPDC018059]|uniref:SAVMC3_10250 family protein n=1 Tax=Streptomyces sp. NPDC018059 TaxID=3365041 RepID=UPI0037B65FB0